MQTLAENSESGECLTIPISWSAAEGSHHPGGNLGALLQQDNNLNSNEHKQTRENHCHSGSYSYTLLAASLRLGPNDAQCSFYH